MARPGRRCCGSAGWGLSGPTSSTTCRLSRSLEPAAADSPRLAALLVGVNAGPVITPWAGLATLLWAARCRSAGVTVTWSRFTLRGALLAPLVVGAAVTALWLVHG